MLRRAASAAGRHLFRRITSVGAAVGGGAPALPGVRAEEDAYALLFTCRVCETRTARRVSKAAYHGGTVLIRCPGCRNMHLIADHKGFFHDDKFDAAAVLAARGEAVARGGGGGGGGGDDEFVLELREEDLAALRARSGSVRLKSNEHGAAGEEPAVLTFEGAVSAAGAKVK